MPRDPSNTSLNFMSASWQLQVSPPLLPWDSLSPSDRLVLGGGCGHPWPGVQVGGVGMGHGVSGCHLWCGTGKASWVLGQRDRGVRKGDRRTFQVGEHQTPRAISSLRGCSCQQLGCHCANRATQAGDTSPALISLQMGTSASAGEGAVGR